MSPEADGHQPVATLTVDRHVMAPGVRRIPLREGNLRGTLFLPPGMLNTHLTTPHLVP
jgi:hypothetical protein